MKTFKLAVRFGWPFLFLIISCSSPKKQFYYFDHQKYNTPQIVETKIDTPVIYASLESTTIVVPKVQPEKIVKKSFIKRVLQKKDSISDYEKEELRKFGVASIIIAPVAFAVSLGSWPAGIVLAAIGIVFSALSFKSDRKGKRFATVGLALCLLAIILALIVKSLQEMNFGGDVTFI